MCLRLRLRKSTFPCWKAGERATQTGRVVHDERPRAFIVFVRVVQFHYPLSASPPLRLSAHDGILARPVVLDCRMGILPKRTETNADRPPLSSDDHKRPQATTTTDHKRRPATTSAARLGVRCFPRRSLVVTRDPHWQFCQPACRFDVLSISPKRTTVAAFYSTIHTIHTILGMCVE